MVGNTDIDLLTSQLPTSSPNAPVLSVGVVPVGTEMTAACEIPLSLFAMKLILTFINFNLSVDQDEGLVPGADDFLPHTSHILTGLYWLQISIFFF